jgi:uncharacterized repeat protein (TIGR01451 family)
MPQLMTARFLPRRLSLICILTLIASALGAGSLSAAEVGANDFAISAMGTADLPGEISDFNTAAAYNSSANEYLVVWSGDDITPVGTGDFEVFGRRINATTGASVGTAFQISSMGTGANAGSRDATKPAVAYNAGNAEWLVVWEGDNTTDGELDIYSRRVKVGAGGATTLQPMIRLSDMGDATGGYDAIEPDVACHSTNGTCYVVWSGTDNTLGLVADEFEIYGTVVQASGSPASLKSYTRLSDMGPDGSGAYDAKTPAVTYNPTTNQYLVVWSGNEFVSATADPEYEIYGQLVGATGAPTGANDVRLTDVGTPGETDSNRATFDADEPDVAANGAGGNYLIVFSADDDWTGPVGAGENEIYGQIVNANGTTTLDSHVRLSDMGVDGDNATTAISPAIVYNSTVNEYMVVWQGEDAVDGENEIYGQRVGASAAEIGPNDFRISDMGPNGDINFDALRPAVAYGTTSRQYLSAWMGDDNTAGHVDEQIEAFGQRIEFNAPTVTNVNSVLDTGNGTLSENEATAVPIRQLTITFSETVSNTQTTSNYLLVNNGTDNTFQTNVCGTAQGDDTTITIDSATYVAATSTVTLTVNGGVPLLPDGYRLFACAANLTDADNNPLDGNGNGTANDDFVRTFTVLPTVAVADLALSKTASSSSIVLGSGNLTYTLTVTNNGPDTSSSVLLTDTLPSSVTIASVDAGSGATCTQPAGQVRCNLGSLATAATSTITIAVTPTASGTITNTAVVGSITSDPTTSNNTDSVTTTVSPATGTANLAVTAGPASQVTIGETKTYTFTITNGGPNTAVATQFHTTMPDGLALVSANSSIGSCSANTSTGQVTCSLGNIASGASATVQVTVRATTAGAKNITGAVSSSTADPTPNNNTALQSVTVNLFKVYLPLVQK